MIYFLPILILLYFSAAASGLASFLGHLTLVIASLFAIKKLSQFYLFWFLVLVTFFAIETRLSLEYLLFASSMFALGSLDFWQKLSKTKRSIVLCLAFICLAAADLSKHVFYERGSLLLWLPAFLALYFPVLDKKDKAFDKKNLAVNSIAAIFIFLGNKKATLLAFLARQLENILSFLKAQKKIYRYFSLLGLVVFSGLLFFLSFSLQGTLHNFWTKSILARLNIWHAAFDGFLARPIFGHGFGNFAIDFPVYRIHGSSFGAKIAEHIAHGHSMIAHFIFEQGIVGVFLLALIFMAVWRYARAAFLPLVLIALNDSSLVFFNQYLLAGLILLPHMSENFAKSKSDTFLDFSLKQVPSKFKFLAMSAAYLLAFVLFGSSLTGHYFYDLKQIDKAIKYDPYHSLYPFVRGANALNKDPVLAEKDLTRAVKLSPNVSYYYGFLAAANLVNARDLSAQSNDPKISLAKKHIEKALKYDGGDAYWFMLASFINYQQPKKAAKYKEKALRRNPEIAELLTNPYYSASEFIGKKGADVRVSSFYRRGPRVYLPLAYIE